jgi:hypothetical protein
VSQDFRPSVFSASNPPRTMILGMKPFRIRPRIPWENRFKNRQNWIPQSFSRRVTQCHKDKDPAVSLTPLNLLPRSHWHYRIFYKNVQVGARDITENAESELCTCLSLFSWWNSFSPWIRALGGPKISWHCLFNTVGEKEEKKAILDKRTYTV